MKVSLFFIFLLCASSFSGRTTVVRGIFNASLVVGKERQLDWLLLQVRLKVGSTVIARTVVHTDGHFTIKNQSNATANLVYCGIGVAGDVYLATIRPHQADTVKLMFQLPISTPQKHGIAKCPKCQRRDKVLPIGGQAGVIVQTTDKKGNILSLPYDKKHYYPDSDVSSWLDPHWHCVRDTVTF